jgi:hypothetical protein
MSNAPKNPPERPKPDQLRPVTKGRGTGKKPNPPSRPRPDTIRRIEEGRSQQD